MKNYLHTLGACAILACTAQAATITVELEMPAAGTYSSPTQITTSQNIGGATFDIVYTLGSYSPDVANPAYDPLLPTDPDTNPEFISSNPFASSNGTTLGVGADDDIASHYGTMEGNDNEELSFTSLAITNFNANGSGLIEGDFSDLVFSGITLSAVGNLRDGIRLSDDDFATGSNFTLYNQSGMTTTDPYTLDLTGQGYYDAAAATDLYIANDSNNGSDRWSVRGLQVSFESPVAVPEPSSAALLGLGGLALILRRRK